MTLRLRLGLVFTALVALVLAASGAGLHFLLRTSLASDLDASLRQTAGILTSLVENDENGPRLTQPGEPSPQLPPDLVAALVTPDGVVFDALGTLPAAVAPVPDGYHTLHGWRVLAVPVSGVQLELMRSTSAARADLLRFDRSFLLLLPIALVVAFVLALALSGQVLRPIDRLTRRALSLAERRQWREELPEPRRRDEVWRLARAANMLLASLREVIEAERTFTANAAHELRTPLTVLRGRLEQALERSAEPGARSALSKAVAANDQLLGLVQALLLLARADAGEAAVMGPVDLVALVERVVADLSSGLAPGAGTLTVGATQSAILVRGDPESLEVAVRNIVGNALKFGGNGPVGISVAVVGDTCRVTVDDSGPGIHGTDRERVFERFYQADPHHRRHGSGLGLAISRQIARAHGGDVAADNRVEGGARVTLRLPLLSPDGTA